MRQNTAVCCTFRNHTVIDAQEKQHLDSLQTGSFNITQDHTVCSRRNRTDFCRRKPFFQNICINPDGKYFFSQQIHQFVQQIHHNLVNLTVLRCQEFLSGFLKSLLCLMNLFFQLQFCQKFIQATGQFRHILLLS